MNVKEFIDVNWDKCIKTNMQSDGTLIGLPYPYTVPAVGYFDELYYWDTYFTNIGLIADGRAMQAKNNVDNMLYLISKYGYMPNGNRTYYLDHSQPPFLSAMVRDVYEYFKDKVWLLSAYELLKTEHKFWTTKRGTSIGLSRYCGEFDKKDAESIAKRFCDRIGVHINASMEDIAIHAYSTYESGWDATPRWGYEIYNYVPVDLNSLLYLLEKNMEYFSIELKNDEHRDWSSLANKRRTLMINYMENNEKIMLDYNYITEKKSNIFSAASFYPLFAGLADEKQAKAIVDNLYRIEEKYGVLACEKNDCQGVYQWGYPNGWACLQYIAIEGLSRYGYAKEAKRIAEKYIQLVDKVFEETGNLWEKYNVVEGNINVANEYKMPAMMGWSAGVYLAVQKYL